MSMEKNMKKKQIDVANKMLENAGCSEEEEEIQWCIDQVELGKKTFFEGIEWRGLDSEYKRAKNQLK